jgi:hypothetical protein
MSNNNTASPEDTRFSQLTPLSKNSKNTKTYFTAIETNKAFNDPHTASHSTSMTITNADLSSDDETGWTTKIPTKFSSAAKSLVTTPTHPEGVFPYNDGYHSSLSNANNSPNTEVKLQSLLYTQDLSQNISSKLNLTLLTRVSLKPDKIGISNLHNNVTSTSKNKTLISPKTIHRQ